MLLDPNISPSAIDTRDTSDRQAWQDHTEQVEEEIAWLVPRIASQVSVTRSQIEQVLRARADVLMAEDAEL